MNALNKFKGLFGEKSKKQTGSPQKKKANHLKEVKGEVKAESGGPTQKTRDKAEVEILQKKIKQKLAQDPNLQKKAAMIIENMLKDKKK